jgi:hypothetical protein
MDMREQFEAWLAADHHIARTGVERAWEAWQAATRAADCDAALYRHVKAVFHSEKTSRCERLIDDLGLTGKATDSLDDMVDAAIRARDTEQGG